MNDHLMSRPLFDFDTGVISRAVASVAGAIKRVTSETISKDFREQINLKKNPKKTSKDAAIRRSNGFLNDSRNAPLRKTKEKNTLPSVGV